MKPPSTTAYYHCAHCGKRASLRVALREYDDTEFVCDACGGSTWVALDDLRTAEGDRLISDRPFAEPPTEDRD
jgi:DNA-directed RNA polymerase subunit RPC12/RpoP